MISTKGRYSIRILLDLAEHRNGSYTPMKEVAARQEISLKYIEKLMPALKGAGLIESSHGIGGGYRLTREPEQYTLWEILRLAEGDLAPVYYKLTKDYFSGITLADLMGTPSADNYVI